MWGSRIEKKIASKSSSKVSLFFVCAGKQIHINIFSLSHPTYNSTVQYMCRIMRILTQIIEVSWQIHIFHLMNVFTFWKYWINMNIYVLWTRLCSFCLHLGSPMGGSNFTVAVEKTLRCRQKTTQYFLGYYYYDYM